MNVAAIDCGTNSIRLLIVDTQGRELFRTLRLIRLGEGVDKTHQLAESALDRLSHTLDEYVESMIFHNVSVVRMTATSAVRDASNKDSFFALCSEKLSRISSKAHAEVITGTEEALLSFRGATSTVKFHSPVSVDTPIIVCDLGGGSTEIALGTQKELLGSYSMDIGCVRLTEKFLHGDPADEQQIQRATRFVDEHIEQATAHIGKECLSAAQHWVGVAGTFTTLAGLYLQLDHYDSQKIHNTSISLPELDRTAHSIVHMARSERGERTIIEPGRVDVIGAGSLIVQRLIHWFSEHTAIRTITISEHDILDGIADSLLQ